MKNVHCISTKQHGGIKSGISQSKTLTISQAVLAGALSCWKVQKLIYPHKCVKMIVLNFFVATMAKLQQFVINEPDKVCHRRRAAIQQVCQHRLRQPSLYSRYTMTSALRHDYQIFFS